MTRFHLFLFLFLTCSERISKLCKYFHTRCWILGFGDVCISDIESRLRFFFFKLFSWYQNPSARFQNFYESLRAGERQETSRKVGSCRMALNKVLKCINERLMLSVFPRLNPTLVFWLFLLALVRFAQQTDEGIIQHFLFPVVKMWPSFSDSYVVAGCLASFCWNHRAVSDLVGLSSRSRADCK